MGWHNRLRDTFTSTRHTVRLIRSVQTFRLGLLDELLNERLVALELLLGNTEPLQTSNQRIPTRIDASRTETRIFRPSHMRDVLKVRGGADHALVDLARLARFLLDGLGGGDVLLIFGLGRLGSVFSTTVEFFEERVGVSLVCENESDHAGIARERVEERPILIISKVIVKLMLPSNTSRALQINHPKPKPSFNLIRNECHSTFLTDVRPSIRIRVGVIDPHRSGVEDLARTLGDSGLDFRLVLGGHDRLTRHVGQRLVDRRTLFL